jgi:hypothetical protein
LTLLARTDGLAQERHKLSWSARPENTKFTVQQQLEIADVPGHVIRMFEIRRTWPENPPMVEGLKVAEEIARGMSDGVAGNGLSRGYSFWRYENSDMHFAEWQNINQAVVNPDRSRKATFVGTYVITGGTGKMRGIKGFGRYSGVAEFAPDGKVTRNEYSAEGEYWIEK